MEKMLIIEGEKIHHVGYRPFLLKEALKRKKITNFEAENISENDKQKVIISMVGEEQKILEFTEFIRNKNNFPDYAKDCKVLSEENKCTSDVMNINDFRDLLSVEQQDNMVQGGLHLSGKIDELRIETTQNFNKMDDKYKLISDAMLAVVSELKEANKIFEKRIEKTEKNIEELLKILVEKK